MFTDVGRSCIIVSLGGKNVMLDCGMHMGYNDEVCKLNGCTPHPHGVINFNSVHLSDLVKRPV